MSFQFSSQGKLREFGGNAKNQGKISESVIVTQKGKVFASFVYVRLVPCAQIVFIDWLVIVAFLREISAKTQGISFS